jgi:hypothetical protein
VSSASATRHFSGFALSAALIFPSVAVGSSGVTTGLCDLLDLVSSEEAEPLYRTFSFQRLPGYRLYVGSYDRMRT